MIELSVQVLTIDVKTVLTGFCKHDGGHRLAVAGKTPALSCGFGRCHLKQRQCSFDSTVNASREVRCFFCRKPVDIGREKSEANDDNGGFSEHAQLLRSGFCLDYLDRR